MKRILLILTVIFFCSAVTKAQSIVEAMNDSITLKTKLVSSEINGTTWKKVNNALRGVDQKYFRMEYVKPTSSVAKGTAELQSLQAVSVVGATSGSLRASNMIQVISLSRSAVTRPSVEYIKLIWTAEAIKDIGDKVAEVNAILGSGN